MSQQRPQMSGSQGRAKQFVFMDSSGDEDAGSNLSASSAENQLPVQDNKVKQNPLSSDKNNIIAYAEEFEQEQDNGDFDQDQLDANLSEQQYTQYEVDPQKDMQNNLYLDEDSLEALSDQQKNAPFKLSSEMNTEAETFLNQDRGQFQASGEKFEGSPHSYIEPEEEFGQNDEQILIVESMNEEAPMIFPQGEMSQVAGDRTEDQDSRHNTTNESFSEDSEDPNNQENRPRLMIKQKLQEEDSLDQEQYFDRQEERSKQEKRQIKFIEFDENNSSDQVLSFNYSAKDSRRKNYSNYDERTQTPKIERNRQLYKQTLSANEESRMHPYEDAVNRKSDQILSNNSQKNIQHHKTKSENKKLMSKPYEAANDALVQRYIQERKLGSNSSDQNLGTYYDHAQFSSGRDQTAKKSQFEASEFDESQGLNSEQRKERQMDQEIERLEQINNESRIRMNEEETDDAFSDDSNENSEPSDQKLSQEQLQYMHEIENQQQQMIDSQQQNLQKIQYQGTNEGKDQNLRQNADDDLNDRVSSQEEYGDENQPHLENSSRQEYPVGSESRQKLSVITEESMLASVSQYSKMGTLLSIDKSGKKIHVQGGKGSIPNTQSFDEYMTNSAVNNQTNEQKALQRIQFKAPVVNPQVTHVNSNNQHKRKKSEGQSSQENNPFTLSGAAGDQIFTSFDGTLGKAINQVRRHTGTPMDNQKISIQDQNGRSNTLSSPTLKQNMVQDTDTPSAEAQKLVASHGHRQTPPLTESQHQKRAHNQHGGVQSPNDLYLRTSADQVYPRKDYQTRTSGQSQLELISETTDLLNSDYNNLLRMQQHTANSYAGSNNPFEQDGGYQESPPMRIKADQLQDLSRDEILKICNENLVLQQLVKQHEATINELEFKLSTLQDYPNQTKSDAGCQAVTETAEAACNTYGHRKKEYYQAVPPKVDTNLGKRDWDNNFQNDRSKSPVTKKVTVLRELSTKRQTSQKPSKSPLRDDETTKTNKLSYGTSELKMLVQQSSQQSKEFSDIDESRAGSKKSIRQSAKEPRRKTSTGLFSVDEAPSIQRLMTTKLNENKANQNSGKRAPLGNAEQKTDEEIYRQMKASLRSVRTQLKQKEDENMMFIDKINFMGQQLEVADENIQQVNEQKKDLFVKNKDLQLVIEDKNKEIESYEVVLSEMKNATGERRFKSDFSLTKGAGLCVDVEVQTDEIVFQQYCQQEFVQQQAVNAPWPSEVDNYASPDCSKHNISPQQPQQNYQHDVHAEGIMLANEQANFVNQMTQVQHQEDMMNFQSQEGSISTQDQQRIQELLRRAQEYDKMHNKLEMEINECKHQIKVHPRDANTQELSHFDMLTFTPKTLAKEIVNQQQKLRSTANSRFQYGNQHSVMGRTDENSVGQQDHNITQSCISPRAVSSNTNPALDTLQHQTAPTQSDLNMQHQFYIVQNEKDKLVQKVKRLKRKLDRAKTRTSIAEQTVNTLQNKVHGLNEKYRDMKNKFEMRIHERNLKVEDLKSQLSHHYLSQQNAFSLQMPSQHFTQPQQPMTPKYPSNQDLNATGNSGLLENARLGIISGLTSIQQEVMQNSNQPQNASGQDALLNLINEIVEKKVNDSVHQGKRRNTYSANSSKQHEADHFQSVAIQPQQQYQRAESSRNFGQQQKQSHQVFTNSRSLSHKKEEQRPFSNSHPVSRDHVKAAKKQRPPIPLPTQHRQENTQMNSQMKQKGLPELIDLGTIQLAEDSFASNNQIAASREKLPLKQEVVSSDDEDQFKRAEQPVGRTNSKQRLFMEDSRPPVHTQLPLHSPKQTLTPIMAGNSKMPQTCSLRTKNASPVPHREPQPILVSHDSRNANHQMSTTIRDMLLKSEEFKEYVMKSGDAPDRDWEEDQRLLNELRRKYQLN